MTSFPEGKQPPHNLSDRENISSTYLQKHKVDGPHCGVEDGYFKAQSCLLITAEATGLFHWRNVNQSAVSIAFVCGLRINKWIRAASAVIPEVGAIDIGTILQPYCNL